MKNPQLHFVNNAAMILAALILMGFVAFVVYEKRHPRTPTPVYAPPPSSSANASTEAVASTDTGGVDYQEAVKALNEGKIENAEKLLNQSIRQQSAVWESHNLLGLINFKRGQYESALQEFMAVTRINPDYATGWANAADCLRRLNRPNEALAKIHRATQLAPAEMLYQFMTVALLAESGDLASLTQMVDNNLKVASPDGLAYVAAGYLALKSNSLAATVVNFEKARSLLHPDAFSFCLNDAIFLPYRNLAEIRPFFTSSNAASLTPSPDQASGAK